MAMPGNDAALLCSVSYRIIRTNDEMGPSSSHQGEPAHVSPQLPRASLRTVNLSNNHQFYTKNFYSISSFRYRSSCLNQSYIRVGLDRITVINHDQHLRSKVSSLSMNHNNIVIIIIFFIVVFFVSKQWCVFITTYIQASPPLKVGSVRTVIIN